MIDLSRWLRHSLAAPLASERPEHEAWLRDLGWVVRDGEWYEPGQSLGWTLAWALHIAAEGVAAGLLRSLGWHAPYDPGTWVGGAVCYHRDDPRRRLTLRAALSHEMASGHAATSWT